MADELTRRNRNQGHQRGGCRRHVADRPGGVAIDAGRQRLAKVRERTAKRPGRFASHT